MLSFFEITAYNTEALYVWGRESRLLRYVEWLNRDRKTNHYTFEAIPESRWSDVECRDDVMSMEEPHWDDFMEEGDE